MRIVSALFIGHRYKAEPEANAHDGDDEQEEEKRYHVK